jgi:hypothetical protein
LISIRTTQKQLFRFSAGEDSGEFFDSLTGIRTDSFDDDFGPVSGSKLKNIERAAAILGTPIPMGQDNLTVIASRRPGTFSRLPDMQPLRVADSHTSHYAVLRHPRLALVGLI